VRRASVADAIGLIEVISTMRAKALFVLVRIDVSGADRPSERVVHTIGAALTDGPSVDIGLDNAGHELAPDVMERLGAIGNLAGPEQSG